MNKVFCLSVLCVSLTSAVFRPSSAFCQQEPAYNGKSVSEWVTQLGSRSSGTEKAQASQAIRQLGTNALPSLLWELHELVGLYASNYSVIDPIATNGAKPRIVELEQAFEALGENAHPGAPELANLFNQGSFPDIVGSMLLHADRKLAEETFVHALTNQSIEVRETALGDLVGDPGPSNALVELAGLIKCLNDETPGTNTFGRFSYADIVRAKAARALGAEGGRMDPEKRVLALLERFQREKVSVVRTAILFSLGRLGASARLALPAMRQATSDPDPYVVEQATKSIQAIESRGR